MGVILGIDYGRRRIGLAVSDRDGRFAMPLEIIEVRSGFEETFRRIAAVISEHRVESIVVGLPLNMDGSEGEQAAETREFVARLQETVSSPIALSDERLSTYAADRLLMEARGGKRSSRHSDASAAAVILQGFLDSRQDNSQTNV